MRALTRRAAQLWTERREELGHPLGVVTPPPAAAVPTEFPAVDGTNTLLFEIGLEELPAGEVVRSAEAVRTAVTDEARADPVAARRGHGVVHPAPHRRSPWPTSRPASRMPSGPSADPRTTAAYGPDGAPTKAAEGFARGQHVAVADLEVIEVDGVEHVGVTRIEPGRRAAEVLSGLLAEVVAELRAEKNMRWRDAGLSYSRPVRWLLALLGNTPIPVAVSSLSSGVTTRVLRTGPEPVVMVAEADDYREFLASHGIVADSAERRAQIVAAAAELAIGVGGVVDLDGEAALLDQIAALVEAPNAVLGSFDPRYLELPTAVLTTVMRKHQRYLPVVSPDRRIAAAALRRRRERSVRPGVGRRRILRRAAQPVRGRRVLLAGRPQGGAGRLQGRPGQTDIRRGPRFDGGPRRPDRRHRRRLSLPTSTFPTPMPATLARAGELAKFDLASQMVVELSSLAGTMAGVYARAAGESEAVATALVEMEQPAQRRRRRARRPCRARCWHWPTGSTCWPGCSPPAPAATGSSDPFGLRRAALGVISILRARPDLAGITIPDGLRPRPAGCGRTVSR